VTLDQIEEMLAECQTKMEERRAELRAKALRLPEMRSMPGPWVRGWLESHGATPAQAVTEIVRIVNEGRALTDVSPIGTCARRDS
jgi:hypothetical protein